MWNLKLHKASTHEGVTYSCTYCEFRTKLKPGLKQHIEKEHNGLTYSWNQCEYHGKSKMSLKMHQKTKHENVIYKGTRMEKSTRISSTTVTNVPTRDTLFKT